MPRLLFIDSGLGGLTVLRSVRAAVPEAEIVYIADDAGFPYGAMDEESLSARLIALTASAIGRHRPDLIVIACNTASTLALAALRAAFDLPFVGTVPAIKPAAALTKTGVVAILATPATVRREYTRALIAEHGRGSEFLLIGAPNLATLAEAHAQGRPVSDDEIVAEIAPCFREIAGRRTDVVVLGCTHYPLLAARLTELAPWPVAWLDPSPAIARRIANLLAERGAVVGVGALARLGLLEFTSRRCPPPSLADLLLEHGLAVAPAALPA